MIRTIQTNFTQGAVSEAMRSRIDNPAYKNAVKTLENCRLHPQGGASRRPGLAALAEVAFSICQIEEFIFNAEQVYAFVLAPGELHIWNKITKVKVQVLTGCPWTEQQLAASEVQSTQNLDTMFISNSHFETQVIKRTGATTFTRNPIVYTNNASGFPQMPFHKFVAPEISMSFSGTTGSVQAYTTAPVFVSAHVGVKFRYKNVGMVCVAVASATEATMSIYGGLPDTGADPQWDEQAFSPARGWAGCTTFHEQRFAISGARDAANAIWLSTTVGPLNFDLGTGQPSDAIKAVVYADRVVQIKALVSYGNLQIYADHGEFIVPWGGQNALTPANFSVKQQSGYGIHGVEACQFDQAVIFITRVANSIREFTMTNTGYIESYAADSITYMAKDLIVDPITMHAQMEGIGSQEANAYVTNSNGTVAVLTRVKKENIGGWGLWTTQGLLVHFGIVDREGWVMTRRQVGPSMRNFIEILDDKRMMDFSASNIATQYTTRLGPFPLHAGATVHMISGDIYLGQTVVGDDGYVTTPAPVTGVEIGYNFVPKIVPLVQEVQAPDGITWGLPKRYVSTVAQLEQTVSAKVGTRTLNTSRPDTDPSGQPPRFTGQFKCFHLGWNTQPDVEITSPLPLPFSLRALNTEVEV